MKGFITSTISRRKKKEEKKRKKKGYQGQLIVFPF
jgi:superfamily II helicase